MRISKKDTEELAILANAKGPLTRREMNTALGKITGPKSASRSLCYRGLARVVVTFGEEPVILIAITQKGLEVLAAQPQRKP